MEGKSKGPARAVIALGLAVALCCNALGSWEGQRLAGREREAQAVNGTVEQGEDPLLVVVNREHALPQGRTFLPYLVDDEVVDRRMAEDLSAMLEAAAADKVWLWVASGYRGEERQRQLWEAALQEGRQAGLSEEEARERAQRTVAPPGHSEHQTGLALDFNEVSGAFAGTEACRWLQERGAEFGFVQRYQAGKEGITGVAEECWHYRYVGREHARRMERLGLCLEEYVLWRKAQEGAADP